MLEENFACIGTEGEGRFRQASLPYCGLSLDDTYAFVLLMGGKGGG